MKNLTEYLQPIGRIRLDIDYGNGSTDVQFYPNLILNGGRMILLNRLLTSPSAGVLSHIAVGSGATTPAVTQTALTSELARVAIGTSTITTVNFANDSVAFTATFGAGVGTGTWNEAGLSNTSSSTITFARALIGPITKTSTMSIGLTWTISLT